MCFLEIHHDLGTIRIAQDLVWVKAYTRKDGKRVAGYARKRARRKNELLILI